MATLNIGSQMAHFRLIGRITEISSREICGVTNLRRAPLYVGLEAMAQLAALDVRQRLQFKRHAFLLCVYQWQKPDTEVLDGVYRIRAALDSQSSNAYRYDVSTHGPSGTEFNSRLLIGTREYDRRFSKDILKAHYQVLFTALKG